MFLWSFYPASFGPPVVSIEIENNSAIVTMKGPIRYQPNHEEPVVHMANLYPQMMYNLSIHNTHRNQMVSAMSQPITVQWHGKTKPKILGQNNLFQCMNMFSIEPRHCELQSAQTYAGIQHRVLLLCQVQIPVHACTVSVFWMALHHHACR